MKHINIDIRIQVENLIEKASIYMKNFIMYVREDFVADTVEKKHNLQNHLYWLKEKIRLNQSSEIQKPSTKWSIYYVDYGINVGNEINGVRPSIMYKDSQYTFGEDIIVIPLTSDKPGKSVDIFDVEIIPDRDNRLRNTSYAKLRQIRSVSKKRIANGVGKITDLATKDAIQDNLISMFGMKIPK
jgi:mRNA-degrading endonuclease toxin of MazEF toxin-antitoxin module